MTAGMSERRVTNTYSKKKVTILLVAAVAVHNVKNNEWRQVPMSCLRERFRDCQAADVSTSVAWFWATACFPMQPLQVKKIFRSSFSIVRVLLS